jgi:hypothetical protein
MNRDELRSQNLAYKRWYGMRNRCYLKTDKSYLNYGARGIYVCSEWLVYENFKKWFWDNYIEGYSIDRIDNDGPYAPWNCRFADRKTQSLNSRLRSDRRIKNIKQARNHFSKFIINKYGDPKTRSEKHCGSCKSFLPLTQFYKRKDTIDGLYNWCKTCVSIKSKLSYKNKTTKNL